ncbi:hypothetical protein Q8E16_002077 [Vibrio alginolyticus]|uniref:hypothetical protein n=1 Tax=Vibrio alginolyticus TaxID=663 RepID=UPI002054CF52|nr:hypothetical protein [Vibrio alginolyticus]ELA7569276.1 hypothetical protein [Vibrio alginolyticus]BCG20811.1 hypothetical protein HLBS07_46630 [Vibrio alginolyticus]
MSRPRLGLEKDSAREIFNGIQNYIYCGVLFYAGSVNFAEQTEFIVLKYLNIFLGISFYISAFYLLAVNTCFLKDYFLSKCKSVFSQTFVLFVLMVIGLQFALFVLTNESRGVKLEDGISIGELKAPDFLVPGFLLKKVD